MTASGATTTSKCCAPMSRSTVHPHSKPQLPHRCKRLKARGTHMAPDPSRSDSARALGGEPGEGRRLSGKLSELLLRQVRAASSRLLPTTSTMEARATNC